LPGSIFVKYACFGSKHSQCSFWSQHPLLNFIRESSFRRKICRTALQRDVLQFGIIIRGRKKKTYHSFWQQSTLLFIVFLLKRVNGRRKKHSMGNVPKNRKILLAAGENHVYDEMEKNSNVYEEDYK